MSISRRGLLEVALAAGASAAGTGWMTKVRAESPRAASRPGFGCLVDLSLCDGCRKCELACNQANHLPAPTRAFDDPQVMDTLRRPDAGAFTVVNKHKIPGSERPVYVKVQCMHCNDPACVSACIVGALTKEPSGAVAYNPDKCLGCRYCMVACPYGIPAYEYHVALAPRVMKCTFCFASIVQPGGAPACAKICPKEAIEFGPQKDVLELAHERLKNPGTRYRPHGSLVNRIYGEHEVGGAAWLYVSPVPFEQLGFLALPATAPPRLTEAIQHGIFKGFVAPIALYSLLGLVMGLFRQRRDPTGDSGSAP